MKQLAYSFVSRRAGFVSTWFALGLTLGATVARAQESVFYPEGYYLNERCLPPCRCSLGPLEGRVFGTYTLNLLTIGDVFDAYSVDDVQCTILTPIGSIDLVGSGVYQQSTIIRQQRMHLDLSMANSTDPIALESGYVPLEVDLPALRVDLANFDLACKTFQLRFVAGPEVLCHADLDDGRGLGILDNAVDVSDLLYYLEKFEAGNVAADMIGGPCGCPDCFCPDGGVAIDDLLFFLRHFEAGC